MTQIGGFTYTQRAMENALENMWPLRRESVDKITVLVTDGIGWRVSIQYCNVLQYT